MRAPAVLVAFAGVLAGAVIRDVEVGSEWGRCVQDLLVAGAVHTLHLVCESPPGRPPPPAPPPPPPCPAARLQAGGAALPLLVHDLSADVTGHSSGDAFVVVTSSRAALTAFLLRQAREDSE